MTDARELFRHYVAQREELGTGAIVLPPELRAALTDTRRDREPDAGSPPPVDGGDRQPSGPRPNDRASTPQRTPGARRKKRGGRAAPGPAIPGRGITVPAPAKDLFTDDPLANTTLAEVEAMVHACTRCALHETRTNGVPGEGPGDARLVVVGEGPGAHEDAQGRPFVGRAGDLLNDILAAIGCPRETVYIANVVKSRPPDNRKPQADEIQACVPYLHRQLEIIRPKVILAMGATAAETLLQQRGSLGSFRNKVHEYRGIPLIVTYHPAALLRNPHWKRPTWDDVRIARQLLDR